MTPPTGPLRLINTDAHAIPTDEEIEELIGIRHTVAVVGSHLGRDFLAGVRDVVGGRSRSQEKLYARCAAKALHELESVAHEAGGNALLAVRLEPLPTAGRMVGMLAVGTVARTRRRSNA